MKTLSDTERQVKVGRGGGGGGGGGTLVTPACMHENPVMQIIALFFYLLTELVQDKG